MSRDACPDGFDHTERPSARKKAVDTRKRAPAGERKHEAAVPTLQRIHEHHEAERARTEDGEHGASAVPGHRHGKSSDCLREAAIGLIVGQDQARTLRRHGT